MEQQVKLSTAEILYLHVPMYAGNIPGGPGVV